MMTCAHETKLISVGFNFSRNHDYSLNQSKWMKKFEQAKAFYNKNGHCNVSPTTCVLLQVAYAWVDHSQLSPLYLSPVGRKLSGVSSSRFAMVQHEFGLDIVVL
jgi:hypothetical protein